MRSLHWSQERADSRKIDYGVSVLAFRDFFVKDHLSFSIVEVEKFTSKEPYAHLKTFVEENLMVGEAFNQILMISSYVENGVVVSHAGTFLRQVESKGKVSIKFYDPNENHLFERGGHKIDYKL